MLVLTTAFACVTMLFQTPGTGTVEQQMRALYDAHQTAGRSTETKASLREFWNKHDAAHAKDAAYLLEKSLILSWLDDDEEARRIFRMVPDDALQTPGQLFNRLQERIDEDLALAKPLLLRLADTDSSKLSTWLHESYAQRFAPRLAAGVDLAAHLRLMAELAAAGSPAGAVTQGLHAWMNALAATDSPEQLRPLLARPLGDDTARAERYRLLLCERALRHEALRPEVAQALRAMVESLEREAERLATGSGNARRARVHYYLAHACHTFATKLCADDRELAIDWLLRAARWDVGAEDRQRASNYFYEIACLGGAEEYRSLCAAELGRRGRKEDARRLWLEAALVVPDRLAEARREILELDASIDFRKLWMEFLEQRLPLAEDFELDTLQGGKLRLSSLRGRWVLLDFWGTWCGPCRQELPALAALDRDLRALAKDRATVLTVACNDTPETVQKFMTNHGYEFSVALGTPAVTSAYAVSGYPTKILITPGGHWLKLVYGRVKWADLVRATILG